MITLSNFKSSRNNTSQSKPPKFEQNKFPHPRNSFVPVVVIPAVTAGVTIKLYLQNLLTYTEGHDRLVFLAQMSNQNKTRNHRHDEVLFRQTHAVQLQRWCIC